ncbi:MAG: tRNA pseudouridine(38-40) synthase TruA [Candidatus Omnitrophota bacterium]|nr:tRNA pseudouridine(38-40) synthase TruA [Candidatus Omnitrophota bacterium]
MRNIKVTIEYDGTNYCGWQTQKLQPESLTIQEVMEKALLQVFQKKVKLIASGRTDSGVHARGQVANFRVNSKLSLDKIQAALNSYLPFDIVIKRAQNASLNFHSRFDAASKTYKYFILNTGTPSPFNRRYCLFIPYSLDLENMEKGAKHILGRHNFKSFQGRATRSGNSIRTIKGLSITRKKNLITIEVESNGFLYNMVRIIVGTLIEVGRGRFNPGYVKQLVKAKDRRLAGPTAPARGLCLMRVNYKNLTRIN